jgi:hypothetical protein
LTSQSFNPALNLNSKKPIGRIQELKKILETCEPYISSGDSVADKKHTEKILHVLIRELSPFKLGLDILNDKKFEKLICSLDSPSLSEAYWNSLFRYYSIKEGLQEKSSGKSITIYLKFVGFLD